MPKSKITKSKPSITGTSDGEATKIALSDYVKKFSKQELPAAEELSSILEAFPLSYLDLRDKAFREMIGFSNSIISNSENVDEESFDNTQTFLKQEAIAWEALQALGSDAVFNSKDHTLQTSDISTSLLRLKIIEKNWPKSKMTATMAKQLKTAMVILNKLKNITYQQAVSLGYGKGGSKGGKIQPSLTDMEALMSLADSPHKIVMKTVRSSYIDSKKGIGSVHIDWEDASLNRVKGRLSRSVNAQIDKVFGKPSKNTISYLEKMNIMDIESSPSFLLDMEAYITTALLGKKITKYKRKTVSKTQYKLSNRNKVKRAKRQLEGKVLPKLPTIKNIQEGAELPLFSIQVLINEGLAKQIKGNMGEPYHPPVLLRNQTGRFSESAKLLTLTRGQRGTLLGTYTYQRDPYDTFLPEGKLGTPERNPKTYIEGSIRELALAIMKRKFPGLVLELT